MALDSLADARISAVAQVQKAYYSYYLADVSIQITRQSEQLLRQIHDVAAARYKAGAATQQDVLRAEVELYGLQNELITLDQQRATARAQLNTLMNRAVDAPLPPPRAVRAAAGAMEAAAGDGARRGLEPAPGALAGADHARHRDRQARHA